MRCANTGDDAAPGFCDAVSVARAPFSQTCRSVSFSLQRSNRLPEQKHGFRIPPLEYSNTRQRPPALGDLRMIPRQFGHTNRQSLFRRPLGTLHVALIGLDQRHEVEALAHARVMGAPNLLPNRKRALRRRLRLRVTALRLVKACQNVQRRRRGGMIGTDRFLVYSKRAF